MIFLDSSFLVAYSNEEDSLHAKAMKVASDLADGKYGMPVITDYIFDEVITILLVRTKNFRKAIETGEKLIGTTLFLHMDSALFSDSWSIFKNQNNPRLSFTDCSIVAVCKANGIGTLVTFDRDLKEDSKLNIVD